MHTANATQEIFVGITFNRIRGSAKSDRNSDTEEAIEQVLEQTESRETRKRKLPSHLVICMVIAMNIWSSDSMRTVLKNLVKGLRTQWLKLGKY
ncbi:transposase domain-containing protein [Nostoc sp. 106C]|uniref:transposase domain-containing protein n=1 Tax=Nostoc sp. 106C TaxID=1932667 RepID=UPI0026D7A9CB